MSAEENKAFVRRFIEEAWDRGNLSVVDEVVAEDFAYHGSPPGIPATREGFRQVIALSREAFPDLSLEIEDVVAEGDRVAVRYTMRGTHPGDLMGIPPSGEQVSVPGIVILRVADGKLTDRWENADELGMMQQLGVVPAPEQAGG
jgi:steroid delta-isomerase-like uncharacterized protein